MIPAGRSTLFSPCMAVAINVLKAQPGTFTVSRLAIIYKKGKVFPYVVTER